MGKKGFSNIASLLTLAAFLIQSAGCVEKTVVVPTAQPASPSPAAKKNPPAPPPDSRAVQKPERPNPFLISDLWYEQALVRTPENQAGATDPEAYRAQRLADFSQFLDQSSQPKKLKGFDHFLNQVYGWSGYALFGAALIGWMGTHRW